MNIKHLVPTGLLAMSLLVAACGGGEPSAESQPKTYDYERADSLDKTYLRSLATIRVNIEETSKLYETMRDGGMSFNGSACNNASRGSSYSGSKAQALNLGVFGADLNYASAYQSTSEVQSYLKATMDLADKLGIRAAFDDKIITKIVEADSTTNRSILLTKAYLNAEDQLYSEDRAELATLMIAGGWTEGMWLAIAGANGNDGGADFNRGLFAHAATFTKVMEMVTIFADRGNNDFVELQTALKAAAPAVSKLIGKRGGTPSPKLMEELKTSMSALRKTISG